MANKYVDENGLVKYTLKLNEKLEEKVDKEEGKSLSTNDFTDEYKNNIDESIKSVDVKKIVVVTEYPAILEEDVLYLKVEEWEF